MKEEVVYNDLITDQIKLCYLYARSFYKVMVSFLSFINQGCNLLSKTKYFQHIK